MYLQEKKLMMMMPKTIRTPNEYINDKRTGTKNEHMHSKNNNAKRYLLVQWLVLEHSSIPFTPMVIPTHTIRKNDMYVAQYVSFIHLKQRLD